MNRSDDAPVKRGFEEMRAVDRQSAPSFLDTLTAAETIGGRHVGKRMTGVALLLAAAIAMAFLEWPRQAPPPPRHIGSVAGWSSPTAFLLETPGRQLRREAPHFGGWYGLPGMKKEAR